MKFRKETEFQETEIGKIPREWKVKKLGEITTEMYYGLTAKAVERGTGLRMLRTTDIKDYKVDWSSLPYCEVTDYRNYNLRKYLLRKNDIIISRAGTAGVSVLVDRDFDDIIFGSYLIKVRLNEAFVHPKFIHYYMQSDLYWKQILPRQAGSTLKNISIPILKSIIIPLPSINEQVKITEILSTIDRVIELYHGERERLERLKRGLMSELLTGRIRVREENGRLSFHRETELQETEIGEIPRGWHVVKLGELIEMNHGERPEVILQEGDVPIYGGGGLYGFTNTYLVDKPYVLILARVGSVGKVYLARGRVWVTDNAIYGYSKDPNGITTVYAYYWLLFDKTWIEKYVRRSAGGYAIITLNSLNNLKLPLPPLNEQKGITKILSTIDKAVDLHYKGKERLERLKRSLMDLLLTGKVRVVDGDVGS
jgi:type I restriction enzyme S subunit